MPTIKEIARECGVSVATVSNIINDKGKVGEETKKRVLQVIQEMNYTPNIVAQNLKTKNTRSIGSVVISTNTYDQGEDGSYTRGYHRRHHGVLRKRRLSDPAGEFTSV